MDLGETTGALGEEILQLRFMLDPKHPPQANFDLVEGDEAKLELRGYFRLINYEYGSVLNA